jgi:MoxR-like ATPase
VAAAAPRQQEVQAAVEQQVRADLPTIITEVSAAIIPGLVRAAVTEATPDVDELRSKIEENATANLRGNIPDIVEKITETVSASLTETAAAQCAEISTASEKEQASLTYLTKQERTSLFKNSERQQKDLHELGTQQQADLSNSSKKEQQKISDLVKREKSAIHQLVREIVREKAEEAFADFAPKVLSVTLPDKPAITITDDVHEVLPELLTVLHARCHALLVGPAGTGKSMLAKHAAAALGLEFQALSVGPTTPMSKVFGYFDAHGNYHDTPFRKAFEHGGIMLLDELDNGHPGLLAELNQALALGTCAFADGMVDAHPNFRLIATGNTYGTGGDRRYVGRQTLDAATLDRFVVVDVPIDEQLELRIALRLAPSKEEAVRTLLDQVRKLRAIAEEKQLPIIISPRASIDGAKLMEAGASLEQVMSWRVTRGLSKAHRSALELD